MSFPYCARAQGAAQDPPLFQILEIKVFSVQFNNTVQHHLWMAPPPFFLPLCHQYSALSTAVRTSPRNISVSLLWACVSALPFYYSSTDQWESRVCRERHTNVILVKIHWVLTESLYAHSSQGFFPTPIHSSPPFFLHSPLLSPPQIPVQFSPIPNT